MGYGTFFTFGKKQQPGDTPGQYMCLCVAFKAAGPNWDHQLQVHRGEPRLGMGNPGWLRSDTIIMLWDYILTWNLYNLKIDGNKTKWNLIANLNKNAGTYTLKKLFNKFMWLL